MKKLSVLITNQELYWSSRRIFSVIIQILILFITVAMLSGIIINSGEQRLQEDWATKKYNELQSIGSIITDKISFQQFRTKMFAHAELLRTYLDTPDPIHKKKLQQQWSLITTNISDLLDITLFDSQGQYKFSTSNQFGNEPLPRDMLTMANSIGHTSIYTSPLAFTSIDDKPEPFIYQLAVLRNINQKVTGYLLVYQSVMRLFESITPSYSSEDSPLIMVDTKGVLSSGTTTKSIISKMPSTMGSSIKQTYPELWNEISTNNFGQFHDDEATFVYLKIELTGQSQNYRNYYLISYVRNNSIAKNFIQWRNILIFGAIIVTLLVIILIILGHAYQIIRRSRRYSIELAQRLFDQDVGGIIVKDNNRIVKANSKAAKLLNIPLEQMSERSLQRILQFNNEHYMTIIAQLQHARKWHDVIELSSQAGTYLSVTISSSKQRNNRSRQYLLVTLEDVSELKRVQQQAKRHSLLNDNAVANALLDANGNVELANQPFIEQFSFDNIHDKNLADLFTSDLRNQWPQITQQILLQGYWKGAIQCQDSPIFQATLKGHMNTAGDIDHIIATLENLPDHPRLNLSQDFNTNRSTLLINFKDIEDYFNSLTNDNKQNSSLLLIDINSDNILSHMIDTDQLENRQREVEIHLLKSLPTGYQMSQWQLGLLIILLPDTEPDDAHSFAIKTQQCLNEIGLGARVCIGIARYQQGQSLNQYINNAEVALKRAKQIGVQNICQAFTRDNR